MARALPVVDNAVPGSCAERGRLFFVALTALAVISCSALPPGADYPKVSSTALVRPDETRLGSQFAIASQAHTGQSGFRILSVGVDGFLARAQMIDAAEQTLDLQYYIFRGDETGRLLTDALLRAANRGVRVRILIDDGDTLKGDEQLVALDVNPKIEIRIFNPFAYRGHSNALRVLEFLFNWSRLDYRMHNKLFVADNSIALVGGRNIGNQYFQMDPESQFADEDVFVAGPVAVQLSATFDQFWNSALAIPAQALGHARQSPAGVASRRKRVRPRQQLQTLETAGIDYVQRIAAGEPYAGLISGHLPLVWANAQVIADSPQKKKVLHGERRGRLMALPVADATRAVQTELLMVTPYFVPADTELQLLTDLRKRDIPVRILTNSLESAPDLVAHSGYMHYRKSLLRDGVDVHEVRALLGTTRGSGQTATVSRHGNYGLHAKLFVFDRQKLFVGSMNFDQRSLQLNTELGLIIDSPELAQQTAVRFVAMVQPENAYALALRPMRPGDRPRLVWQTLENGQAVEYTKEPARSVWQRIKVRILSWLPLGGEL